MYCKYCGKELDEGARFCMSCGANVYTGTQAEQNAPSYVAPTQNIVRQNANDAPNMGYSILCFLWPILGLILYLVWNDQYPMRAKSCGKGAIAGVIAAVIIGVLYFVIIIAIIIGSVNNDFYYYSAVMAIMGSL